MEITEYLEDKMEEILNLIYQSDEIEPEIAERIFFSILVEIYNNGQMNPVETFESLRGKVPDLFLNQMTMGEC